MPTPIPPFAPLFVLGLIFADPALAESPALTQPAAAILLPESLPDMLARTLPAVVSIAVTTSPGEMQRDGWGEQGPGAAGYEVGAGVIVDGARGLVITNAHLVRDAAQIDLRLMDGRRVTAELVGLDPQTDIAVLRIPAEGLTAMPLGQSSSLRVGDGVVAVGNPFGLSGTVSAGIVSALGRDSLGMEDYEDFIQVDASIGPGNSGGPLIDLQGRLLGINTAIAEDSVSAAGIGFAIPVDMAMRVAEQIVAHGQMNHGALGVGVQDLDPEVAKGLGIGVSSGVVVTEVLPRGPGEAAGLEVGDVLTQFEGRPVRGSGALRTAIGLHLGGDQVRLGILRGSKRWETTVQLASRSQIDPGLGPEETTGDAPPPLDGVPLQAVPAAEALPAGVMVTDFGPGAAMGPDGLFPGDVIVAVGARSTPDLAALASAIAAQEAAGGPIVLRVYRDGRAFFLALPAGAAR